MSVRRHVVSVVGASVVAPTKPTLTAPADNATILQRLDGTVSATITAGQVPDRVDFVLDPGASEIVVATDSASPYSQTWNPTQAIGAHTLVARFVYGSGHVDSDPINITLTDAGSPTLDLNAAALTNGLLASWSNAGSAGGTFTAAGTARPTAQAGPPGGKEVLFDGTANVMTTTKLASDFVAAAHYMLFAVVKITAIDTNNAAAFNNDCIFCEPNEYVGMHLNSTPQLEAYHFDGAEKKSQVATTVGAYVLLQQRYDGTKIYARSGSAAETAGTTAGSIAAVSGPCQIGLNGAGAAFYSGSIVRLLAYATVPSANEIVAIRANMAAEYGVAV